ncbi:putative quinol monooxygenase [Edaphobacter aggregans]|uniref:putative quinol monooxygenase n=1 Tax=Edaphobacter aggregans TaxID=570835 RepID=UPI0012FC8230|nr:putative quinol monooxygenase [Edaphobacter aggregans]
MKAEPSTCLFAYAHIFEGEREGWALSVRYGPVSGHALQRTMAQQGKGGELKALRRGLVQPTRAEAGWKYYELFESNLAGIFLFNELWESQKHLDAHAASSHFTEIFGKASALLSEPLEVNLLTSVAQASRG